MSKYRGFTVSFNEIGAGKIVRKYLLLAVDELLTPLLLPANKNMVEAKCRCQLIFSTRAVYRKGAMDTWIRYQLVTVIAPTLGKHAQAKKMLENILPGSTMLEEYRDTAKTRLQCNEFVPDNKHLVFSYQRNGITHHKYGEVYDLRTPTAPPKNKETNKPVYAPWHVSKRERHGVFLTTKNFPLQHKLNMIGLLDMLLLGVDRGNDTNASASAGRPRRRDKSRSSNRSNASDLTDVGGGARRSLTRRRPSAARAAAADRREAASRRDNATPGPSFGLQ